MVLTEKQQLELHAALIDYFESNGLPITAAALRKEAGLESVDCSSEGQAGALEKKWTAILRLQKKVADLEAKVAQLSGAAASEEKASRGVELAHAEFLPRTPVSLILSGHRRAVTCVALHPRYNIAVSGSEDASIKSWDLDSGSLEKTLTGHTNTICEICFNSDGSLLVSCSNDTTIKLWDFGGNYRCIRTLQGHSHAVTGVCVANAGNRLYSCSRDSTIAVWDIDSGHLMRRMTGHADWVRKVAINASDTHLYTCSTDKTVMVWDIAGGKSMQTLLGHENVVECIDISEPESEAALRRAMRGKQFENGTTETGTPAKMATVTADSRVTPNPVIRSPGIALASPVVSSDVRAPRGGAFVVSGSRDRTVKVWDAITGACFMTFSDSDSWVRAVKFHPCGLYVIAVGEDRCIRILDIAGHNCLRTISEAADHFITSLAIRGPSSTGLPLIVVGSDDRTVRVWQCK